MLLFLRVALNLTQLAIQGADKFRLHDDSCSRLYSALMTGVPAEDRFFELITLVSDLLSNRLDEILREG